ncbi:MAG: 30S ribosomal protein S16 [Candidatus Margulisiibacteriota bacterium]|nr:30S ribosomal protein S16 [Candidatus Margulisiibacteriota bacterium]
MAPKIKLQRVGAKNKPKYRIIVQEERAKLNGSVIEILGQYNPRKEPSLFEFDKEKMEKWIKNGAQPTEKVRILLGKAGVLPPVDLQSLTKRKSKSQQEEQPAAAGEAPKEGGAAAEEKPAEPKPEEEAK